MINVATAGKPARRRWLLLGGSAFVALVLAAFTGWAIGRADSGGESAGSAQAGGLGGTGVDLGGVRQPEPTGEVKEFDLVAREAPWEIAPGVTVNAMTFNGTVPGPTIRVTEGDTIRVTVRNELPEATSVHWHGLHIPNEMDGVPPFTQDPIEPGETFTYEFAAPHAGTFMYHSHLNAVEQVDRGLYGLLIIDPQSPGGTKFDREFIMMLSAWMVDPTMPSSEHEMPGGETMAGQTQPSSGQGGMNMDYNYFTINGKAFPLNDPWTVREGDVVRVRIANISNLAHPMHLHGADFAVVAKDGEALPAAQQQVMNTLSIDAGETYDIVIVADNPGTWVFHCHELHHTENDGVEPGGLIQVIQYEGYEGAESPGDTEPATPSPVPEEMPGMGQGVPGSGQDISGTGQRDMPGMDTETVSPTPSSAQEEMPGTGGMDGMGGMSGMSGVGGMGGMGGMAH